MVSGYRGRSPRLILAMVAMASLASGCQGRSTPTLAGETLPTPTARFPAPTAAKSVSTPAAQPPEEDLAPTSEEDQPFIAPTPDPYREPPPRDIAPEYYSVEYGDTLNDIAWRFGVAAGQIAKANGLQDPNWLAAGQELFIPTPYPQPPGPSFKLLPDSEFVYGPVGEQFDLQKELEAYHSPLLDYKEAVNDEVLRGQSIVELVARHYSIDPRLLLAILEYQGGWMTHQRIRGKYRSYPVGYFAPGEEGLYRQLSWAANELSRGYYLWRAGWAGPYHFQDGVVVNPGQGINAATAGIQQFFSQLYVSSVWRDVVAVGGFYQTYQMLFGDPFQRAIEPLVPEDLEQPALQLPFESGVTWSFTGGPHRAWGSGTGWAALDFAPPSYYLGCVLSNQWVVASAEGLILRAENGEVIQDLDGDGIEGTGWALLYMHIEGRDRLEAGTFVHQGDRIGHPSCEGGVADGTHVHIARKYNGEWIAADGPIPFNLDGWVSTGWGREYDGSLSRGDTVLEACACRSPSNQISR